MSPDGIARVQIPEKAAFLLTRAARYKVLEGGRDAIKSWSVARSALVLGAMRPTRFLCCRELMTSVEESIYQLLTSQIVLMGLTALYEVQKSHIYGRKGTAAEGTQFAFTGLRHNVDEIKSYEGFDVAIVEEAKNVSRSSWDTLIFTIRKAGSEIWVVLNPELETDETYLRFVKNPPSEAIVEHFTWRDNPWPSTVLAPERERMRVERPDDYHCIWEGRTRSALAEAIYGDELRAAELDGRIGRVPWDGVSPVDTFWDLGHAHLTSVWFLVRMGLEWHAVDYYDNSLKKIGHYLEELQARKYLYGTHFLPHDAENETLGSESIHKQVEKVYPGKVIVVPRVSEKVQTHNAVKNVFHLVRFDRERCEDGLEGLRHYRFKRNAETGALTRDPLGDWASDVADGFGTFALARNLGRRPKKHAAAARPEFVQVSANANSAPGQAWMGS